MSAGLPYLRGRRRRFAALLLPALLLRALIPFGFMPVVEGSGMTIGLCPGELTVTPGIAAAHQFPAPHLDHHQAHHSGGGHAGDAGGGAHHAPCLFAASATPAFAPANLAVAVSAADIARPVDSAAAPVYLPTILRAQSPRGPPQIT